MSKNVVYVLHIKTYNNQKHYMRMKLQSNHGKNVLIDIFLWAGKYYMVTVDYASSFFELDYLPNTTSDMIVGKLKHHFVQYI